MKKFVLGAVLAAVSFASNANAAVDCEAVTKRIATIKYRVISQASLESPSVQSLLTYDQQLTDLQNYVNDDANLAASCDVSGAITQGHVAISNLIERASAA